MKTISLSDYFYRLINFIDIRYQNYYKFKDKYYLVDRIAGEEDLLIILAGKKAFLWEIVFPRIYSNLRDKIDVIIVNPGDINSEWLKDIAGEYGFSYLATKSRRLSTSLNFAIKKHQNAKWIYKIDDDTFINEDFFRNLKKTYKDCEDESIWDPGMVVPVININNFTYYHFLKTLDLIENYTKKFGKARVGLTNPIIRSSNEAAIWIWKRSLPLGKISSIFLSKNADLYEICPFRFSISAILFKRDLWERMRGFNTGLPGRVGIDETSINKQVLIYDLKQIIVCLNTFVGHFSYYTQEYAMKKFFLRNKALFKEI